MRTTLDACLAGRGVRSDDLGILAELRNLLALELGFSPADFLRWLEEMDILGPRPRRNAIADSFADILPERATPLWLRSIAESRQLPNPVPYRDILNNSVFYPACGVDLASIAIASNFISSFIFVDCHEGERFIREVVRSPVRDSVFELIHSTPITGDDLRQVFPPYDHMLNHPNIGGALTRHQLRYHDHYQWQNMGAHLYGNWSIWRKSKHINGQGEEFMSLLFLQSEGFTAFVELYLRNCIVPQLIVVANTFEAGHFAAADSEFWQLIAATHAEPEFLMVVNSHIDFPFPAGYSRLAYATHGRDHDRTWEHLDRNVHRAEQATGRVTILRRQ